MNRRRNRLPYAIVLALVLTAVASAQTGVITTVAGNGQSGSAGVGGPATNAQLGPAGICLDSAENLYIADARNNRVLRVAASSGILTLVAGNGTTGSGGDYGPATQASLNSPYDVVLDSAGNLFIAELYGNRIRRVDAVTGIITTVAGNGTAGFSGDSGQAIFATLNLPIAIAIDPAQNLYIADNGNVRVRRIDAQTGVITTVAGNGVNGSTPDGGPATAASIAPQFGVSTDHAGNLLISEFTNARLRRVDAATGILSTVAGNGGLGFTGDAIPAVSAGIGKLGMKAVSDAAGNIFFPDGTGRIRRVDAATGMIVTVAGNGTGAQGQATSSGGGGGGGCYQTTGDNGPATNATLDGAFTVALAGNGNLLLADWLDCRVRRVFLPSPFPYTNTSLSVSPAPSAPGQQVTFTTTVAPIGSGGTPTGAVQFVYQPLGLPVVPLATAPLINGTATFNITGPSTAGAYPIVAYYSGDGLFNGSGSPAVSLTVSSKSSPTVTLSADQNPATLYANVTFTVTVAPPSGNANVPTGTIQLSDASGAMPTQTGTLINGLVQFSTPFATIGLHPLTASYSGDSNFNPASSTTLNENVRGQGGVTLTSDTNPSPIGSPVRFTAAITPSTATGTVQFLDGGTVFGSAIVVNGSAFVVASSLSLGSHSIQANYSGDSQFSGAASAVFSQTVNLITTTTAVSANTSPSVYGQAIALTATVSPSSATGSIIFRDGDTFLGGANLSGGTAAISVSTLTAGPHSITAFYQGDLNDAPSTSVAFSQTVTQATPAFTLVSSLNPSLVGQSVTLTTTLTPPSNGAGLGIQDSQPLTPPVIGTWSYGQTSITLSTLSPGRHSMTATWGGDANVQAGTSAVFIQTVQAPTTIALTAGAGPFIYGQPVTLTATVSPAAATGSIQFSDGAASLGTATITAGIATLTVPSLAVGSHPISCSYAGDGVYLTSTGALNLPVAKAATTVSLSSSLNPSTSGQAVTFTVTVSPSSATGSVQFLDGPTVLGTAAIGSGTASFSTSSLAAGGRSITAVYSGDGNFNGSTSAVLAQTVKTDTTTSLSSSTNPSLAGQAVTLTATISAPAAGGTVQFIDGATLLGTVPVSGGSASLITSALTAGSHSITVTYSGDTYYNGSSSNLTQSVKAATTTTLSASSTTPIVGQAVTLTVSIAPATATGSVQFMDGATVLGTSALNGGSAALSISTLTVGTHSITAIYSGDANDNGSTSAAVVVTVGKAASSTTLSASSTTPTVGQAVTLTASITPATATGTVQFLDGATVLGTSAASGGSASLSISTLTAGTHSITAIYSGDANDNGGTSSTVTVTVGKAASATTLSASSTTPTVGQAITLTASVAPPTATGTVQFLDGATVLGTSAASGGSAALSISTLTAGTHSITAIYSGDANDNGSTSSTVTVTVGKMASSLVFLSSLNPSVAGQSVTYTATVSPSAATGTVQFKDGATVLGTVTLSGGTAVFSTSTLTAGSHSIGTTYSGDGTYNGASAGLTQVVKATSTTALSASTATPTVGQIVNLTASITPATATGSVQFLDGATVIGTAAVNGGSAALSVATLAVGAHGITAVYSGDGNDTGSTSGVVTVTVGKSASSTAVTSSLNPAVSGQSVTFTATVLPSSATGTVQFKEGATVLGTATLASGSAGFATSGLAVGSHSITAVYGGDGNTNGSTSAVLTETVTAALPGAPSNLVATAVSSSQINLTWTASPTSGVTYNVYASGTSGFTPSSGNRIASGVTTTSYSNTGLAASTTRYYLVTAHNANGESAASNQASATTSASGVSCKVVYTVTTQWNVGFGTAITIQNTGSTAINGWALTWTWAGNQQITQSWNSNYTQTGPNAKLTNASWNPTIAPGATLNGMGFNASYSGTNTAPSAFYVNGTKCN